MEEMKDFSSIVIRKRGINEEITALDLTPDEYVEILRKYGKPGRTVRINNGDDFQRAEKLALPGEVLLRYYRSVPETGSFERAVVLFARLFEMMKDAMFKYKKFRTVINYDAELLRTEMYIYTPMESGEDSKHEEEAGWQDQEELIQPE